jgi:hypothetical protein
MEKRTVDNETLKKGLLSATINLVHAESICQRISKEQAKNEVAKFVKKDVLTTLLDSDPNLALNSAKEIMQQAVDRMIEEYKDKPDKAYTALLRLKEIFE